MAGPAARAAYALVAVLLVASGCTGGGSDPGPSGSAGPSGSGGALRLLSDKTISLWDPQRLSTGPEAAIAVRTFTRTLTGYQPGGAGGVGGLVGDLATDIGTPSDDGRVWSFTLRSGPAWEDGQPVTCDDVRYGISRAFARDQLPGGAPYPVTLLDIASTVDRTGREVPDYPGPYDAPLTPVPTAGASPSATAQGTETSTATATATSTATSTPTPTVTGPATDLSGEPTGPPSSGAAAFEKAVSCAGAVLTIRLKVPVPDFPQIVALPAFAPFRADRDRGGAGPHDVFSCGPYRLDGAWEVGAGGRFVRNPAWDRASDPLRQALPDVIDIREAIPVDTIIQRLSEDKAPDNTAVGLADLPGARLASLLADPAIAARLSNPSSGTVELLQPNLKSPTMSVPAIRQAFSLATDRTAFVAAYGPMAMSPTTAVLPASIASPAPPGAVSAQPSATMLPTETAQPSATAQPTATQALTLPGGPESAATVLAAAGVTLPVRVRVAYRSSPVADLAYAALAAGWERAGFEVVLDGLGEEYYDTVSAPQASERYDVFRTAWFADYPSGSAVIPALFDGRMNLTDQGTGQDLGSFNDEAVNAAIDAALVLADPGARAAAWNAIDAQIASLGGHVALAERRRVLLRGSGVAAYAENPFLGGWVDLAAISVR